MPSQKQSFVKTLLLLSGKTMRGEDRKESLPEYDIEAATKRVQGHNHHYRWKSSMTAKNHPTEAKWCAVW